jgi:hypothetical protein
VRGLPLNACFGGCNMDIVLRVTWRMALVSAEELETSEADFLS